VVALGPTAIGLRLGVAGPVDGWSDPGRPRGVPDDVGVGEPGASPATDLGPYPAGWSGAEALGEARELGRAVGGTGPTGSIRNSGTHGSTGGSGRSWDRIAALSGDTATHPVTTTEAAANAITSGIRRIRVTLVALPPFGHSPQE
jgi:hypothetical protein